MDASSSKKKGVTPPAYSTRIEKRPSEKSHASNNAFTLSDVTGVALSRMPHTLNAALANAARTGVAPASLAPNRDWSGRSMTSMSKVGTFGKVNIR